MVLSETVVNRPSSGALESDGLLFQYDIDDSGGTFVCIAQAASCTGTGHGISIGAGNGGDQFANIQYLPLTGPHVIATVASAPPVPRSLPPWR